MLTFLVKNGKMKLPGKSIFEKTRKDFQVKSRNRSRPPRPIRSLLELITKPTSDPTFQKVRHQLEEVLKQ